MRRTPIKTGTQLNFPVLRIGDFFCVFLRYQIVINCVFSYFNWVITQIRSLIKVLTAYSAPALELNIIIFKHVYWYMQQISGERLQDHWSSGLNVYMLSFK